MSVLDFKSDHINLEKLADGVYAAIKKPGGGAFSNAALIDLGDRVLAFDAFETHFAASDLRRASQELIGREPDFLIISHWHGDHWKGSQVFADIPIISTFKTRQLIINSIPEIEAVLKDPSMLDKGIAETQEQLQLEEDPSTKDLLESNISSLTYRRRAIDTHQIVVPNQTFTTEMEFIGSKRRVKLAISNSGHTLSDSVIYLDDEKIAFIADLGFFGCHPFVGSGKPDAWVKSLKGLEDSDYDVFVPGHGPVGTVANVSEIKLFLTALANGVKAIIEDGGTSEDAAQLPVPPPYDQYVDGLSRFPDTMAFFYKYFSGK